VRHGDWLDETTVPGSATMVAASGHPWQARAAHAAHAPPSGAGVAVVAVVNGLDGEAGEVVRPYPFTAPVTSA
jgi:hypothetical protein